MSNPCERYQRLIDDGEIAGVVTLVASRDAVLDVAAMGKADIASDRPMKRDAMFWIASMTKPITAALLMMLVDEGKIALDDPLEKHIPAFAGIARIVESENGLQILRPAAGKPTIRQAMSHTSGLPFFSRPEKTIDIYPLDQAAMTYAMSPLLFEPGTKYQYGNVGINSVGRIIELASGQPYKQFLRSRLLEPLGMKDTTFVPDNHQQQRMATAYAPDETKSGIVPRPAAQLSYPLTNPARTACPGGGLFSTAEDVGRFARMILHGGEMDGHRYLSKDAIASMTSTQTGSLFEHAGPGSGYGIGWETFASPGDRVAGSALPGRCRHAGALSTQLNLDPHTGLASVLMIQQDGWISAASGAAWEQFLRAGASGYGKVISR